MISLYTLTSALHDEAAVVQATRSFLSPLELDYDFKGASFASYGQEDSLDLIFVRTGGTEGIFRELLPTLRQDRPFYLLASGTSNSLAASMEILSFLNLKGLRGEILHGSPELLHARIKELEMVCEARRFLRGKRLGVVGAPSDWLISSGCDREAVRAKAGIEIQDIPISLLLECYRTLPEGDVTDWMKIPCREGMEEAVHGALEGADRIYRALKSLIAEYRLDGLTLRCFDLLTAVGNTGCLALARLNSEGYVATCEGDIPAMLTMLLARALSGQSGFQCNPARMDPQKGEILFAHCTLPLSMARDFNFDTHFESGIGVGIHGNIPEGPVTILKVDGALKRTFACDADLERNEYGSQLCRTQVLVRLSDPSVIRDYFLREPIGNHHVLLPGHHAAAFKALLA